MHVQTNYNNDQNNYTAQTMPLPRRRQTWCSIKSLAPQMILNKEVRRLNYCYCASGSSVSWAGGSTWHSLAALTFLAEFGKAYPCRFCWIRLWGGRKERKGGGTVDFLFMVEVGEEEKGGDWDWVLRNKAALVFNKLKYIYIYFFPMWIYHSVIFINIRFRRKYTNTTKERSAKE